jgi:hypothetical protein
MPTSLGRQREADVTVSSPNLGNAGAQPNLEQASRASRCAVPIAVPADPDRVVAEGAALDNASKSLPAPGFPGPVSGIAPASRARLRRRPACRLGTG